MPACRSTTRPTRHASTKSSAFFPDSALCTSVTCSGGSRRNASTIVSDSAF